MRNHIMKFLKNKGFAKAKLEVSLVNLYLNSAYLSRVVGLLPYLLEDGVLAFYFKWK